MADNEALESDAELRCLRVRRFREAIHAQAKKWQLRFSCRHFSILIMPIHIAITRRVKPGCEAEFQQALREFFQTSFAHGGVLGATMIVPPPGSDSREFGILRTFADEAERDTFYASPIFKAWEVKCAPLTESGSW